MCSDILALDEADHIDALSLVDGLAVVAAEGLGAEDATGDVDHLQGGLALDAEDHEVAVADEAEVALTAVGAGSEDQFEA